MDMKIKPGNFMKQENKSKLITISILIIGAAFMRLLPHPPNVTPITAIALFGGFYLSRKSLTFLIPLTAMLISDLFLGIHYLIIPVYLSFVMITFIGSFIKQNSISRLAVASIVSSTLFFIITNFAEWMMGAIYPKTLLGLQTCFIAAIPFYTSSAAGDMFYTAVLFGSFAFIQKKFFVISETEKILS
jgi:hypothetical protein